MGKENNLDVRVDTLDRRMLDFERWQKQEEERRRKKIKDKIVQTTIGAVAPAAAGGAFVKYCGKSARNLGEFVGETCESVNIANKLLRPNARESEVQKYIGRISPVVGKQYLENRNEDYLSRLEQAATIVLDAAGRASEKFPTTNLKPVRGLRGMKGWIIEKTKGIGKSKERKEEITITNTENYQEQYNKLAEIKLNAIARLRKLNSEIEIYCAKLAVNEIKKGDLSKRELQTLEKLAEEYNNIALITEGISSLSVAEINQGIKNPEYQALVGQARDYGIKTSDFSAYGAGSLMIGTALAAYTGYKLAKPLTNLVKVGYKGVALGVRGGRNLAKKIRKK